MRNKSNQPKWWQFYVLGLLIPAGLVLVTLLKYTWQLTTREESVLLIGVMVVGLWLMHRWIQHNAAAIHREEL